MSSAPSPPPVPQASQIIPQAANVNLQTAQQQAALNNVSQSGWGGGIQYNKGPDGTYSLKQSLNPQVQNTVESNLGKFNNQSGPLDPSGAVQEAIQMQERAMDPYFRQQEQLQDSQLKNQGFVPQDEAFQMAQRQLRDQQGALIQNDVAQFEPLAYQQSMQNYLNPLQVAQSAYQGLGFNPINTPQTGVPATDAIGAYGTQGGLANQQYQQKTAQYNQMLAGLFSIPAAIAGSGTRALMA